MKIRITFDVGDDYREAINRVVGRAGRATYTETEAHLNLVVDSDASELCFELHTAQEASDLADSWADTAEAELERQRLRDDAA